MQKEGGEKEEFRNEKGAQNGRKERTIREQGREHNDLEGKRERRRRAIRICQGGAVRSNRARDRA